MVSGLVKNILIFISLFYLTFYLPFVLTSYNPYWMKYNCGIHKRCERIGVEKAERAMGNLTSFLMHRGELSDDWRINEKVHLKEVRHIFDIMLVAAVVAAFVLVLFRKKRPRLYKFAVANIIIALCLLIVLPNFKTFWRDIFHPILFDNDLWKVSRRDLLYYVTPRAFFKITTAVIISSWVILNLLIALYSAFGRKKTENKPG